MHHGGSFTLPGRFLQLFEVFAAVSNGRYSGSKKPQNSHLYTKAAAKANPPVFGFPNQPLKNPDFSTTAAC
jgi:hypothetical protein